MKTENPIRRVISYRNKEKYTEDGDYFMSFNEFILWNTKKDGRLSVRRTYNHKGDLDIYSYESDTHSFTYVIYYNDEGISNGVKRIKVPLSAFEGNMYKGKDAEEVIVPLHDKYTEEEIEIWEEVDKISSDNQLPEDIKKKLVPLATKNYEKIKADEDKKRQAERAYQEYLNSLK